MRSFHASDAASPERLSAIDLNLVVAFDAIVRERSVTRAAQRVGVTQSAMSHILRRLRQLLGDPLVVRGKTGLVLTPRAEALIVPLRSGLVTLGRALAQPDSFEPGTARRAFRIVSLDLFDVVVVPALLERVRGEAPDVEIAIVPAPARLDERLETGEVDVAIRPAVEDAAPDATPAAPGLVRRTLLRDRLVCFVRAGHPVLAGRRRRAAPRALSLATYAELSHALVSPSGEGRGLVDQVLEQHGLSRRIALRIPHFYSALAIVARSDLILTAPAALVGLISAELPVVWLPPPIRVPGHRIDLVWHERFSRDAGHRWLRDLVTDAARATQVRS
jgi:DNA-binding transcriptional LysR family regulator